MGLRGQLERTEERTGWRQRILTRRRFWAVTEAVVAEYPVTFKIMTRQVWAGWQAGLLAKACLIVTIVMAVPAVELYAI